MPGVDFDIIQHHRDRTRRAEARAAMLEHIQARLERLLAITLRAAAGNDCDPLTLLKVIERLDEEAGKPGADYDKLAQLLHDPSSDGPKQEAAA